MEAETKIVNGAYRVDAQGDIEIVCRGDGAAIQAESGQVNLSAAESVNLTCGNAMLAVDKRAPQTVDIKAMVGLLGKILLTAGPPEVGPKIEIDATSITLSIGPPGVGTSIELSPRGITLQFGINSFKLTGAGIEETVLPASRTLTFMGQEVKVAETEFKVGLEGLNTKAPLVKEQVLGVSQVKATATSTVCDAVTKFMAGIDMHGS